MRPQARPFVVYLGSGSRRISVPAGALRARARRHHVTNSADLVLACPTPENNDNVEGNCEGSGQGYSDRRRMPTKAEDKFDSGWSEGRGEERLHLDDTACLTRGRQVQQRLRQR
jgi:hypothetical protein